MLSPVMAAQCNSKPAGPSRVGPLRPRAPFTAHGLPSAGRTRRARRRRAVNPTGTGCFPSYKPPSASGLFSNRVWGGACGVLGPLRHLPPASLLRRLRRHLAAATWFQTSARWLGRIFGSVICGTASPVGVGVRTGSAVFSPTGRGQAP